MKKEELFENINDIDNKYIKMADTYMPKKKIIVWSKWTAVAACICLVAVVSVVAIQNNKHNTTTGESVQTVDEKDSNSSETNNMVNEDENSSSSETNNMVDEDGGSSSSEINNMVDEDLDGNSYSQGESGYNIEIAEVDSEQDQEGPPIIMMIDHYDKSLNSNADMAINNGCYVLSDSLKAAIEKNSDTVNYRVVVEVFKDGVVIDNSSPGVSAEEERLTNEKYIVAHETYENAEDSFEYFTIHATAKQLLEFATNDEYGYYISFYGEYSGLGQVKEETGEINISNTDIN